MDRKTRTKNKKAKIDKKAIIYVPIAALAIVAGGVGALLVLKR